MCELFAISAKSKYRLNELLEDFYSHSSEHPDGWSVVRFKEDGEADYSKDPGQASKSERLKIILSHDIEESTLLAHIRFATIGRNNYHNCHPFVAKDSSGRNWTFIHNGTFFRTEKIKPFAPFQKGNTDSEQFFLYLIDQVNREIGKKGDPLSQKERFGVIDRVVYDLSYDNKLNFIIYDGELMYIHRNAEGGMTLWEEEGRTMFSTAPLVYGEWKPLKINTPVAYMEGKKVFEGRDHGNEFVADDHDWSFVLETHPELREEIEARAEV
jgi:predicted glutamine amidotransferase